MGGEEGSAALTSEEAAPKRRRRSEKDDEDENAEVGGWGAFSWGPCAGQAPPPALPDPGYHQSAAPPLLSLPERREAGLHQQGKLRLVRRLVSPLEATSACSLSRCH